MDKDDLEKLREEIDRVDQKLLQLIQSRNQVVSKIADYKNTHSLDKFDQDRYNQLIADRAELAQKLDLDSAKIEQIWEILHQMALDIEEGK